MRGATSSYAGIAEALRPARGETTLVGVDGAGGSGKSTFARRLAAAGAPAVVAHTDDLMVPGTRGLVYDWRRLEAEVLAPSREGRPARYRRYDWDADALAEWHEVPGGGMVIVEGITALRREHRDSYVLRVWVEAPWAVRLARGVERDGEEARGRWTDEFMPAEERYFEEHDPRAAADLVVDGTAGDDAAPAIVEDRRGAR